MLASRRLEAFQLRRVDFQLRQAHERDLRFLGLGGQAKCLSQ
jgi:hypothetical protein